ncbi:phage tail tip lysozyme [Nitratireductor sp. XY-223]|uniref:phage tail tip lysozyme n=1 Tax=Nitratireductor sp. XY-223 TaxID=2561926 RepID=UPI0010AA36C9|nr:phage tail tip lysozyme [Nitratireductor sp. XY-223]
MKYQILGLAAAALMLAACSSTIAEEKQKTAVPATQQSGAVQFAELSGYNAAQTKIANKITSRFAAAGYGRPQQVAAVSVAIRESTLNPKAHNRGCNCFGLFQMNRSNGLGRGHSVANLTNADYNISLILKEAGRFPSFKTARTVDEAVSVFVRNVTRPANKPKVVRATIGTARKVERSASGPT